MLPEERKNLICDIVNKKKAIKVSDLSKRLGITEATVRRDLDELQNEKKIRRTHGGAVALYPAGGRFAISDLAVERIQEKIKIAKRAYEFIDNYDTLLLDGSSTVLELCKLIANGPKKDITVVTNAFSVVTAFANKLDITVVHVGGEVTYPINSSIGKLAEKAINNIRVDKTFLGVNGIDVEYGYSISNLREAAVKMQMIKSAKQVFVLADHTKFGSTYLAKIAEFTGEVDYLITDERIKDFDYGTYNEYVNLIIVDEEEETNN
ncbi:MAG: DeoR/GlpR family DNA-binding transcription regulator [Clostridia bacterium]|nr:DeoR/GlpR family DNA-binding transcription regulator [Clostridia bacterium]